jgi:AraC-like DNA-binding protein
LRVWFAGFIGIYTLGIIAAREIFFPDERWLDVWQYMPAGGMLLVCNCVLLEFKGSIFIETPASSSAEPVLIKAEAPVKEVDEVPEDILEAIAEQMEQRQIYREMGLTIGQLAETLELQEYRLRRIINAGMGYRNFNDFLNTYRIREASSRLVKEGDTAVLNIALDVGFRSLSSFNKAFKDAQLMTPTAYRSQAKEKGSY